MGVNTFSYEDGSTSSMATDKTQTVSIRVPKEIAEWLNHNGGAQTLREILYAHVMVACVKGRNEARSKLLQIIITESASSTMPDASTNDETIQPSFRMD